MEFTNITGFIGIIFLSVYFFMQKKRRRLLQEGISTEGTVIDLIEESNQRNGSMIYLD